MYFADSHQWCKEKNISQMEFLLSTMLLGHWDRKVQYAKEGERERVKNVQSMTLVLLKEACIHYPSLTQ